MNIPEILKDKALVIAIDGHSSCGKSTIAKTLASLLGYSFIDTGAMYRAVAYYSLQQNIPLAELSDHLDHINLHFKNIAGTNCIFLNDENVSTQIRLPEVSAIVSEVAAFSPVRAKLVELQQSYGKNGAVVMDGRDIGSKVFPDADVKLFVTADIDVRAKRRFKELLARNNEITLQEVVANLSHRDHIDSTRADSPLVQVPDAILVNTSQLTREEQLQHVIDIIAARLS